MIQAQRCGAECHPKLYKLHSFGLSKLQPGEMPAPWFVQLILCQRSISWGTGGLKFLWFLFKLSWEMIKCSKTSNPDDLSVCIHLLTQDVLLSEQWGVWAALSSLPARPLCCWWHFSRPTGAHFAGREKASTGCWCKQPTICSCGGSITTNTLQLHTSWKNTIVEFLLYKPKNMPLLLESVKHHKLAWVSCSWAV